MMARMREKSPPPELTYFTAYCSRNDLLRRRGPTNKAASRTNPRQCSRFSVALVDSAAKLSTVHSVTLSPHFFLG